MGRGFNNDILTLGVLAIGGYLIYTKTDWFQQFFEAVKSIAGEVRGGVGGRRPSSGGAAPSGGGDVQGDLSASGGTIFPSTGKTWTAKDSGKKTRNYASGGSSGTTQYDIKGVGAVNNLESTVDFDWGNCNDTMSIKHYGPDHSDGNCCWIILNVDGAGKFFLGGEGNHPTTEKSNLATGSSMGSIKNKRVQIKFVTWIDSQVHARGYGNVGGQWKEFIKWDGSQFGAAKKASKPASDANVQFRIDCSGIKIHSATCSEIRPTGGATSAFTRAGQYSNSLFTVNQPIPLGYYNNRLIVEPYCDQVPVSYGGRCYDRNDSP